MFPLKNLARKELTHEPLVRASSNTLKFSHLHTGLQWVKIELIMRKLFFKMKDLSYRA